jgi:anti-anti-sigma factor
MSRFARPTVARRETVHRYLTIRQTRRQHDLEKVLPIGEIDLCTAPVLARALEDIGRREVPNVLVDLSQVNFLALIGVQTLLTASDRARTEGRRLVVVATTPTVQRVLSLTDVAGDLEIYVTNQSAQSALAT